MSANSLGTLPVIYAVDQLQNPLLRTTMYICIKSIVCLCSPLSQDISYKLKFENISILVDLHLG